VHPASGLIPCGLEFFTRHGGKSVCIGGFFGPLRAVISLAAGLMWIPRRFWVANVASALVWVPSIFLPGALLSTAVETTAMGQSYLPIVLVALGMFGVVGVWITKRHAQTVGIRRIVQQKSQHIAPAMQEIEGSQIWKRS
jgi:membrane protein DedA with SNARE-associated domain